MNLSQDVVDLIYFEWNFGEWRLLGDRCSAL